MSDEQKLVAVMRADNPHTRAQVAALFASGNDSFGIGLTLGLQEPIICTVLRILREKKGC